MVGVPPDEQGGTEELSADQGVTHLPHLIRLPHHLRDPLGDLHLLNPLREL